LSWGGVVFEAVHGSVEKLVGLLSVDAAVNCDADRNDSHGTSRGLQWRACERMLKLSD